MGAICALKSCPYMIINAQWSMPAYVNTLYKHHIYFWVCILIRQRCPFYKRNRKVAFVLYSVIKHLAGSISEHSRSAIFRFVLFLTLLSYSNSDNPRALYQCTQHAHVFSISLIFWCRCLHSLFTMWADMHVMTVSLYIPNRSAANNQYSTK